MKIKQENFETDCLTDERIPEKCYRDEESWESYIEGLKQYFVLHGTFKNKKVSALLTFMGIDGHKSVNR